MDFMNEAIKEAKKGIAQNHGGPFGSVIVKDGAIIGVGHNMVVHSNDPTAHGEIMAIRDACRKLNTFDLSDCEIYTTAEPCPMCLGAILWSNINTVYYGCNQKDTEAIGFRDSLFYDVINKKSKHLIENNRKACLDLFKEYTNITSKTLY